MQKLDGRKINKRGGSNKGMADGYFLRNKYPWRHGNLIAQSKLADSSIKQMYQTK